ncbi:MAG TPA: class I lanthipeptide [Kofleriaceae bacterium]|jgi:hypothetical protein|nr:class I lanthipeptide [Kofleriaceae bacterium]
MKKSQKQVNSLRKLRLQREVITELKPPQLARVEGGEVLNPSAPRCSDF